jgi:hypothetical protein
MSPFRGDGRLLARLSAARPRPGQETPSAETSRAVDGLAGQAGVPVTAGVLLHDCCRIHRTEVIMSAKANVTSSVTPPARH